MTNHKSTMSHFSTQPNIMSLSFRNLRQFVQPNTPKNASLSELLPPFLPKHQKNPLNIE